MATLVVGSFSGSESQKRLPVNYIWPGFTVLRDHTWIVWRQPWVPSHAFGPMPLSRLVLKSPCRERSTKRTFTHLHLHMSQVAPQAGAYPGFSCMKRLAVFLLCPWMDGLLVHRIKFAGTHFYTWVERGTMRVKCLAQ